MAPAVLARILEFERKDDYNITVRPRFTVAGAPPPQSFIERLEKEIGWEFIPDLRPHRNLADPDRLRGQALPRRR